MRVVAGQAIGFVEGLVLMRFLQVGVLGIVAVQAEAWRRLCQMEIKLCLSNFAGLMSNVARLTTHIECGMTAAFFWNAYGLVMAGEAKIVFLISGGSLQQLVLVVGDMRVMAGQAVPNRRLVDRALAVGRVLVGMTGDAQLVWGRSDQLYPGYIFVHPDFVTAQASGRDCRMDGFSFGLVLVTLETLRGIDVFVERHRMSLRHCRRNGYRKKQQLEDYGVKWRESCPWNRPPPICESWEHEQRYRCTNVA